MIPQIRTDWPHQAASDDLPVYRKDHAYETDCTCRERDPGRIIIDGRWVVVCMQCGSLRIDTGT
jgi:hypothetical protein